MRFKPNLKPFKKFEKAETGNQTGNQKLSFGLVQTEFESVSNQTSPTLGHTAESVARTDGYP